MEYGVAGWIDIHRHAVIVGYRRHTVSPLPGVEVIQRRCHRPAGDGRYIMDYDSIAGFQQHNIRGGMHRDYMLVAVSVPLSSFTQQWLRHDPRILRICCFVGAPEAIRIAHGGRRAPVAARVVVTIDKGQVITSLKRLS